jgi:hypothetical protein
MKELQVPTAGQTKSVIDLEDKTHAAHEPLDPLVALQT